jgi:hypothetical protein
VANKYIEWHRRKIGDITASIKDIVREFPQTRLKKYIVKRFNDEYLTQHRVLGAGEEYEGAIHVPKTRAEEIAEQAVVAPEISEPAPTGEPDELSNRMDNINVDELDAPEIDELDLE